MPVLDPETTAAIHARLRRWPDVEHPALVAVDAADRLILDEAAAALETESSLDSIAVIDDAYGALTLPLLAAGDGSLRVGQDLITGEQALVANAQVQRLATSRLRHVDLLTEDGVQALSAVRVVLLRLPRALAALDEIAGLIARHASDEVHVIAGAREKYLTPAMTTVLRRHFTDVSASRGRQKSRVLHARGPRSGGQGDAGAGEGASAYPQRMHLAEIDRIVVAHGAAFAGPTLDLGTRVLLRHLGSMRGSRKAVDLGCGTGLLAVALAAEGMTVTATDASAAAVHSARATVAANGVAERIDVVRAHALAAIESGSVDLIVCNPPFHSGSAVVPDAGTALFADARRVLRPGGALWTVSNSRLSRARDLRRLVGPTKVVEDDGRFTVTRTTVTNPGI